MVECGLNFSESIDEASHCARGALGMMERHRVPAHPRNFAVWYAYVADRMPDLTAAVNQRLGGGGFTAEVNSALFEQFFGAGPDEQELREVGRHIEDAVDRVLDYLVTASHGTDKYGEALVTFSGRLADTTAAAELAQLIRGVAEETLAMAQVNRDLEGRLAAASAEIGRLREDLDDLRREASVDHLTGLANRKLFEQTLRQAQREAEAASRPLSLLMLDIDYFKQFNDTHGHVFGDQMLKLVARSLTECLKGKDTAARYGGEEFVVVLPDTGLADAATVAEGIRATVAGKSVTNRRTGKVLGQVTLSIGVAEYVPGETAHALVNRADEALYRAKGQGRNRVIRQGEG
jgi:diguanylate cyclase